MKCVICGKPLRRRNKTGYCYIHWTKGQGQSIQTVLRRCLKCDQEFLAMGRYNRICPTCHETNKEIVDASRYQLRWIHTGMSPG